MPPSKDAHAQIPVNMLTLWQSNFAGVIKISGLERRLLSWIILAAIIQSHESVKAKHFAM
jgi:hypothetical protein